jgi:hypothetical protein
LGKDHMSNNKHNLTQRWRFVIILNYGLPYISKTDPRNCLTSMKLTAQPSGAAVYTAYRFHTSSMRFRGQKVTFNPPFW